MCMKVGVFSQKIAQGSSKYCDHGSQKHLFWKKKHKKKGICWPNTERMSSQGIKTPKIRNQTDQIIGGTGALFLTRAHCLSSQGREST